MGSIDGFAYDEYKAYLIYSALADVEKDPELRRLLRDLAKHELEHYKFWLKLSSKKEFSVNPLEIFIVKLMRIVLGLTFVAKFLELKEKSAIAGYTEFLKGAESKVKSKAKSIIAEETGHEHSMRGLIKEERVAFISSIILGLNDAMIELTGALVGFSFMFANPPLVAVTGLVTGIAASLSMAASAYMQASHEEKKDAKKAAAYTGTSYIIVVLLLVAPFFLVQNVHSALAIMAATVFVIIASISYYSSVIFERDFKRQFGKMLLFSVGVSIISFALGSLFRAVSGVNV
jgi:VIT1/CCC1 family predicted Fe2+/Mn2+ transporter